jgi:hypothetical protein
VPLLFWQLIDQMKNRTKIFIGAGGILTCVCACLIYLLFHGYFDRGHFEVKQAVWCSPHLVAIDALRWDEAALGGYQRFVLIGDHVYSPAELRHALYSDAPVFSAGTDCLNLRWESETSLIIECKAGILDPRFINRQKWKHGSIVISYKNIAQKQQ